MSVEELTRNVLDEMKENIKTESIMGKPVITEHKVVIPFTRVNVGFGAGGTEGKSKKEHGGACGCGAKIEPVGFLQIDRKSRDASVIRVRQEIDFMDFILNKRVLRKAFRMGKMLFKELKKNMSKD